MKSFVIFVQAAILFVIGLVVAALAGLLAGIAGKQWLDAKAQADAEKEAELMRERMAEQEPTPE